MIVGFSWGSTDHAVLAGSYYDNIRFHEVKIIRSIKLDSSYNQFVPLSLSANNAKFFDDSQVDLWIGPRRSQLYFTICSLSSIQCTLHWIIQSSGAI